MRPLLVVACVILAHAVASGDSQAPPARLRAVDYLDGAILVDAYIEHKSGGFLPGPKLVHGRIRDTLEIPLGNIQASTGGSAPRDFSLQLVTVDDLETGGILRLVYVGRESLGKEGFASGVETCFRYDPLPDRRVTLGSLIGFGRMKPVADPGPLARLMNVQLDDLNGILLRVPGTMEICTPAGIFTLSVVSADGVCREHIDGSVTRYRCEHVMGDTLKSSAEMHINPDAAPPAYCATTTGAGSCRITEHPKPAAGSPAARP